MTVPAGVLRRTIFATATGVVAWAWSEVGFWAHFRPGDGVGEWLMTIAMYSIVANLVIVVVRRVPVTGWRAVVLVGALYGWLVEGMVAATVYVALPFSVVWTAVAWHSLLTVVLGWVWLPALLRRGGRLALLGCAAAGVAWGIWSASWWGAPPESGEVTATYAPASYAAFVLIVTGAAAVAYGVQAATAPRPTDPRGRREGWPAAVVLLLWAVPVVFLPIPFAPLALVLLVGAALLGLRRLGDDDPASRWRLGGDDWQPGVPWSRLVPFAAVPVAAITTYVALSPLQPETPGEGVLAVVFVATVGLLCLVGTVLLSASVWRARHRREDLARL